MSWEDDWMLGLPLFIATIVLHVTAFLTLGRVLNLAPRHWTQSKIVFGLSVAIFALFAAVLHTVEALVWALLYVYIGAVPNLAEAILYSLEAITSYGHAPAFLPTHWRLLGGIEAVNGLILFGLTTAFFFSAIQDDRARHSKVH
ncbi:hypothetical protein E2544_08675 [Achromobacter insolitus]|uniref:hypothetical protein n=1 Tax=Achromobacter insolitus TaxID=217204 RepID=UPI0011EAA860|nr:hypothetical protein [Achromobacter insolitus]QEK91880.1 hypothetical protein E2544_08675 [Achromobacter insolitus]GLK92349.1 hypothetical protein GCM10008164_00850 [Achromobacter xylosoxidans]